MVADVSDKKEDDWGSSKNSLEVKKERFPNYWGEIKDFDEEIKREREERDYKRFLRWTEIWVLLIFVAFSLLVMLISSGSVSETKEIILASLSIFTLVLGIDKGKRD